MEQFSPEELKKFLICKASNFKTDKILADRLKQGDLSFVVTNKYEIIFGIGQHDSLMGDQGLMWDDILTRGYANKQNCIFNDKNNIDFQPVIKAKALEFVSQL